LRQILINLVGNAVKFTSEGAVTLHVSTTAEDAHQATLRFVVRDTGIGIPSDKLNLIFDAFTQADSSTTRLYGGTGLGLAICKQLVELMGGSIGVDSTVGKGSTFYVIITLEKQIDTAADSPETGNSTGTVSPTAVDHRKDFDQSRKFRLLLAEDELTNQNVTKSILERSGYLVDVAGNGSEALQALAEQDYDLVLMDCMMPVMNGYEATKTIRDPASAVRNHDIPVIALTANAMKEDRDRCLESGMNDYLAKPIDFPKLFNLLEMYLHH